MTKITVYSRDNVYTGICVLGHANDNAEEGSDIICAGISALSINFINSVEKFTEDKFVVDTDENQGLIDFKFCGNVSSKSRLLMNSLILGLEDIKKENKDYILLDYKEV